MRHADRSVMFDATPRWMDLGPEARRSLMRGALALVPPGKLFVYFVGPSLSASRGLGRVAAHVAAESGALLVCWRVDRPERSSDIAHAIVAPRGGVSRAVAVAPAADGAASLPPAAARPVSEAPAEALARLLDAFAADTLCGAVVRVLIEGPVASREDLVAWATLMTDRAAPWSVDYASAALAEADPVLERLGFAIRRGMGPRGGRYRLVWVGGGA